VFSASILALNHYDNRDFLAGYCMSFKSIFVVASFLMLAACNTTNSRIADVTADKPARGSNILIVVPDIELSEIAMAGDATPKADWSQQGRDNVYASIKSEAISRTLEVRDFDPTTAESPKIVQLLKLHSAVGQSILGFNYGLYSLPTKKGTFNWTLGEGARQLGKDYDADYALFTWGRGTYSSKGRKAAMVAMALMGASLPTGSQNLLASLIDLKTGKVVWFNVATASVTGDMRSPEGASSLVETLLKDAPL
jgi:hypothetical protein